MCITLMTAWAAFLLMPSCSGADDDPVTDPVVQPIPEEEDPKPDDGSDPGPDEGDDNDNEEEDNTGDALKAAITDSVNYSNYPLLKNLNFVYPSKDPFGKPVMLSGTITMSRELLPGKKAQGFILYNHYTVMRADECPSRGKLDMQNVLYLTAPNRNFITVSADYYGFGETEDRMQAYCIGSANARASLDALIAARQLLSERGYSWDDHLLNVGYSQGGQTSIAVLKLATEEYPDLRFDNTLAGGGPYDLEETYRQYLAEGSANLPSAVVNILLAYNEYFNLGIDNSSMFQGTTLSHLDDWWLSKQYSSSEIDRKMGTHDITQFLARPLLDLDSDVSIRMMEALGRESLCRGWTPRPDEHIILLHHNADDISPSANTQLLYNYLKAQGVDDVELIVADFFSLGFSEHVSGAVAFLTIVGKWIRDNYEIQ